MGSLSRISLPIFRMSSTGNASGAGLPAASEMTSGSDVDFRISRTALGLRLAILSEKLYSIGNGSPFQGYCQIKRTSNSIHMVISMAMYRFCALPPLPATTMAACMRRTVFEYRGTMPLYISSFDR